MFTIALPQCFQSFLLQFFLQDKHHNKMELGRIVRRIILHKLIHQNLTGINPSHLSVNTFLSKNRKDTLTFKLSFMEIFQAFECFQSRLLQICYMWERFKTIFRMLHNLSFHTW